MPFLILGNKIDIPHASSEEELRHCLGLTNYTTGKGKVNLEATNMRPIEAGPVRNCTHIFGTFRICRPSLSRVRESAGNRLGRREAPRRLCGGAAGVYRYTYTP